MNRKSLLKVIGLATIASLLFANLAYAISPPRINTVKSPYDGTKQTITGSTDPGARVTLTGGPFQIPPVTADENGWFEITVSLSQDNTNIFQLTASDGSSNSDPVEVRIVESATKAAAEAASTGADLSAPDAPIVDPVNKIVDTYQYLLQGKAEPGSTIKIKGSDTASGVTSNAGIFSISVNLEQNKKNTFYLEAIDTSGNISPKSIFEIIERGEVREEEDVRLIIDEVPEIAAPFSDLAGHPKERYIETLRLQGVLSGYPDGTVRPNSIVNRAELLKMAMLSFELNVLTKASSSPFTDVPRYSWFGRFVETGKAEGVIGGYPDGTFRPEQSVNRAEALKIILESSRVPYNPSPVAEYLFTDVGEEQHGEWYYPYMHFLAKNFIIRAGSDGSIRPSAQMTRGDLAEIIVRLQEFQVQQ